MYTIVHIRLQLKKIAFVNFCMQTIFFFFFEGGGDKCL